MPSDVFWTGVFTLSGGLAGTFAGYASAISQTRIQDKQLQLERERHRSERAHVDDTRRDRQREQRREIYLRYLLTFDTIINSATEDSLDHQTLSERWRAFVQADNEIELDGDEKTKEASYPLNEIVAKIAGRFADILDDPEAEWPDSGAKYLRSIEEEQRAARQAIVNHMRRDLRDVPVDAS
jgi:hypothetical protein